MRGSCIHTKPIRHHHKNVLLKSCFIAVLCLCIGGCAGLIDRHFKHTLDTSQGTTQISGLREKVTVSRDVFGIPFVQAKSKEDLAMAIGYIHAADRLTQMLGMKLVSQGRLSEMAGPSVLNLDIYMRTMNLRRVAENLYKNISPENLSFLERYCDGVNAYIAQHQDKLPPGLAMTGYTPEAWKPIDSIMIFSLVNLALSFNLHEEIAILSVAQALGPENTAWLLPIYPDEPLPFDEAAKLKEIDLKLAAESVSGLAKLQSLLSSVGLSGVAASNNWAIGKDRTRGRASILCNDQHLFLSMPSLYNMMHIRSGEFDVAGMNIAGIPCIIAGYNGHIAWGMTMVMADNQDIFLEKLKLMGGRLYYLYKGQWLPTTERKEVFQVKGEAPVAITVHETVHGPLLNDTLNKEPIHAFQAKKVEMPYGIALNWAVAAPDDESVNAYFSLNAAKSVEEATSIMKRIRAIPLNMVFADKDNIAWQVTGNYPMRTKGRGLMPSPGWTGAYDWTGLLDPGLLPNAKNPAAGFIGTANNRTISKDYPYVLSSSWYWPERGERIEQMASATDQHTTKTGMDMQLDTHSLFVPKLKAALMQGGLADAIAQEIGSWKDDGRKMKAGTALSILQSFDGNMTANSKGAALVSAFLDQATRNIFLDEMGSHHSNAWKAFLVMNNRSYNATCDHLLIRGDESPFWDDIHTPGKETKAQILARSLADAVALMESTLGRDAAKWNWGALHTYTWETDTSKMAPHMGFVKRTALNVLWPYFNRGPYPAPGDHFTLNVSAYTMGNDFDTWLIPSMRMIVDFSLEEPMVAVNSSGQSDNPSSPHYDDGIKAWRDGSYIPFPFKEEAVKAHYKEIMILQPSSTSRP